MADLKWFPVYVARWLDSQPILEMLPEQEGAYIHLLMIAWGDGGSEPRLKDDPKSLAALSRLGKRWAKLGGLVRDQFEARGDGYLYNAKQVEVWHEQQAKHARQVAKGASGGKAKAKHKASTSREQPQQLEVEEAVETSPKGLALPASAPSGALAPEAPRAPARGITPAIWAQQAVPERRDSEADDLRAQYRERLLERVDEWCGQNPEDAAAITEAAKVELIPAMMRASPTAAMNRVVRERLVFEVAKRNPKWPSEEAWIAQQNVRKLEESAA